MSVKLLLKTSKVKKRKVRLLFFVIKRCVLFLDFMTKKEREEREKGHDGERERERERERREKREREKQSFGLEPAKM